MAIRTHTTRLPSRSELSQWWALGWYWLGSRKTLVKAAVEAAEDGKRASTLFALLDAATSGLPGAHLLRKFPFPEPGAGGDGVAWLLSAECRIVPFHAARRPLLDELRDWCERPGGVSVALLHGAGGTGKTRLAVELACELDEAGWRAGRYEFDSAARETDELLRQFLAYPGPQLLIVDYAEQRPREVARLLRYAIGSGSSSVRILLLARNAGEWWWELRRGDSDLGRVTYAATVRELEPVAGPEDSDARGAIFREAAAEFANRLGRDRPERTPDLAAPEYGRPLFLHMAALAHVYGSAPATPDELIKWVLDQERRLWRDASGARDDAAIRLVERGAAMAILAGSADALEDVPGLWKDLVARGELSDAEAKRTLHRLSAALARLYPSSESPGVLKPDILGEELVAAELAGDSGLLAAALAEERSEAERVNAFTVLARLAARRPEAAHWLDAALALGPARLLAPALEAAKQFPDQPAGPLERAWAALSEAERAAVALELESRLPHATVAFAGFAFVVTEAAIAAARGQSDEAGLAGLLNNLSNRLADLGRRREALRAIEEAVAIRRHLAARDPDTFAPDLARSLNNLSLCLSDLGRREEALSAIEEAVAIRRRLAARDPDTFAPDLARSLNNLSLCLSDLGRREEALSAIEEAVAIRRRLAERNPDAFEPDLAQSLNNLSNRLSDLGRREEALQAIEEAVALWRRLAKRHPDAFEPDLAASLNNLSAHLSALDRREEALSAVEEAVAIYRRLAARNPDAFERYLAGSLNNLSVHLAALGRREEALAASEEAVGLYRRLAARNPDAFEPDLARALGVRGMVLDGLGRPEDAVAAFEEAIRTLRAHFLALPQAHAELMTALAGDYLRRCEALGREPDAELLAPIRGLLARSAGEDEPPAEPSGEV